MKIFSLEFQLDSFLLWRHCALGCPRLETRPDSTSSPPHSAIFFVLVALLRPVKRSCRLYCVFDLVFEHIFFNFWITASDFRGTVVKRFEIGLLNKRSGVRIPWSASTMCDGSTVPSSPENKPKKWIRLLNQGVAVVSRCKLSNLYSASFPPARI